MEEIQAYEAKTNNMNNVRTKLESTLDDLEDELQMEKKAKTQSEKIRRKLEGELKRCLEAIDEKEKENNTIKQYLTKREKELAHMVAKLEDEQSLIIKNVKQIKELGVRIEELEDEVETERHIRAKLENQRNSMNQELDDLSEKLKEAQAASEQQADLLKRKDLEFMKLRKTMEEEHKITEIQMEGAKRNYQNSSLEMAEKVQNLENINERLNKEKQDLYEDNHLLRDAIGNKDKEISNTEKKLKSLAYQHEVGVCFYVKSVKNIKNMKYY